MGAHACVAVACPRAAHSTLSLHPLALQGLLSLHDKSVLHRDIKPKNVFLTGKAHVRLGDLGCAKLMKGGLARTQIGTPYYMSPEIWSNHTYDAKSDMWALGCLLFELAQFECVSAPCMWMGGVLPMDSATLLLSETHCCAKRCLSGVFSFPAPSMVSLLHSPISTFLSLLSPLQPSLPRQ